MRITKHLTIVGIWLFIISIMANCSTHTNTSSVWKNENINEEILANVRYLNEYIINAFLENDPNEINFLSDNFLKYSSKEDLVKIIQQVNQFTSYEERKILDEFFVQSTIDNATNVLFGDNYKFTYRSVKKESYVSLIQLESNQNFTMIVGLIYGNYGDSWKLDFCQISNHKIHDKTAIDYYNLSKEYHSKKHLIRAFNNIMVAKSLSTSLRGMLVYNHKDNIEQLSDQILKETNEAYKLPMDIKNIKDKPSIFNITHSTTHEGIIPVINYTSNINFNDNAALEKEYIEIAKFAKRKFRGLSNGGTSILFKAWESTPADADTKNTTFVHYY